MNGLRRRPATRPWAMVRWWPTVRSRLMPRPDRDEGSAVVEFVALGLLLLVPVVYLVVTLGRIQAATFAVDGGARSAARAFVTAADDARGGALAASSARLALLDQGFTPGADAVVVECSARPCLTPQGRVVVRVSVDVVLPGFRRRGCRDPDPRHGAQHPGRDGRRVPDDAVSRRPRRCALAVGPVAADPRS